MFGKVKKWLGIEGVKLELLLPEEAFEKEGVVNGAMRFQSMNQQTVTEVKIVLIERYSRGRGAEKLIDEYELGSIVLRQTIEVPANEPIEIDFTLPFAIPRSDIDQFGKRNFLFGGLAKVAKMTRAVKSEYRIEAEARVQGVALNPFDKKVVVIK